MIIIISIPASPDNLHCIFYYLALVLLKCAAVGRSTGSAGHSVSGEFTNRSGNSVTSTVALRLEYSAHDALQDC